MRMRAVLLILAFVMLLLVVGYWFGSHSGRTGQTQSKQSLDVSKTSSPEKVSVRNNGRESAIRAGDTQSSSSSLIREMFSQPITIFGRVVDQDDRPIQGATIRFGVHDKAWQSGSSFFRTSDAEGLFEMSGVSGAAANTEVSKDGYYNGSESRRVLKAGDFTSKESPAIFKLYKKGVAVNLVYRPVSAMELGNGVNIVYFDFKQGRLSLSPSGSHVMEVKLEAGESNVIGREWTYQIRIPGGGLQKRSNEFQFIAPDSGYSEVIEGGYERNAPEWRGGYNEHLIAQLPDGSVARFEISIGVQRRKYVRLHEIAYNPDPASRNLELDPSSVTRSEP